MIGNVRINMTVASVVRNLNTNFTINNNIIYFNNNKENTTATEMERNETITSEPIKPDNKQRTAGQPETETDTTNIINESSTTTTNNNNNKNNSNSNIIVLNTSESVSKQNRTFTTENTSELTTSDETVKQVVGF